MGLDNKKKTGKKRKQQILIGLKYQKFSTDLLGKVLEKVTQKGLGYYHRKFIEFFLAYSYFRVPQFRLILLLSMEMPSLTNDNTDDLFTRNQSEYYLPDSEKRNIFNNKPKTEFKLGILNILFL